MNWLTAAVTLEHQDAGPLVVLRVILHELGRFQTAHYIAHPNAVSRQFVLPVQGDSHLLTGHQRADLLQCLVQTRDPFVFMVRVVPLTFRGSPAAAFHGAFYTPRRSSAAVGCSRLLGGTSRATLAP